MDLSQENSREIGGVLDGLIAALVITLIRYALSKPTNAVLRFAGNIHLA